MTNHFYLTKSFNLQAYKLKLIHGIFIFSRSSSSCSTKITTVVMMMKRMRLIRMMALIGMGMPAMGMEHPSVQKGRLSVSIDNTVGDI